MVTERLLPGAGYSPQAIPVCRDTSFTVAVNNNHSLDLKLLASDVDADLDPSGFSISQLPSYGAVSLNSSGIASYTTQFNYSGVDTYEYTATDLSGSSCMGTVSVTMGCPGSTDNTIYGTVFTDYNEDGTINNNDQAFSQAVTINLYEDNSPNDGQPDGPLIQTVNSDANGNFRFDLVHDYLDTLQSSYFLAADSDDAREKRNGNTENDKGDHKITKDRDDEWNGFRFNNISIPGGAIITNAYVIFTSKDDKDGSVASLRFYGEDNTANPSGFSDCNGCYDITSRPRTSQFVNWYNLSAWSKDNRYNSPDLSSIIQEIVDDQGGLSSGSIAIITQSLPDYQERKTYSFDDDPSKAPELVIEYAYPQAGLEFNYIIEIDSTSIPGNNPTVTGPTQYSVMFDALGQTSCYHFFGIAAQTCTTIYSNRFIRYNNTGSN